MEQNQEQLQKLTEFINAGYKNGLHPDEIANQLRQAGWPNETIDNAFKLAQAQLTPTNMGVNNLPPGIKRGRIKTGWILFKESWKLLRSDDTLFRFVVMNTVFSMILFAIFAVVMYAGHKQFLTTYTDASGQRKETIAPLGFIPLFIYYVIAYFIVNIYTAGLAINVLDLFHGKKQSYGYYMKKARTKAGKLFFYSVVEATVGIILRYIAERSRLLGQIAVSLVGLAWSIATLFVVPILATTDEKVFPSIKESSKLLISTWGENIVGRASMGGAIFLFYLLVAIPISLILFFVLGMLAGVWGVIAAAAIVVISFVLISIVTSTASAVLNVALYYYATTKQVPSAFDASLLNSVFIYKKKKVAKA